MLSAMSGDGRPPRRVFLSHTSELRRYPAGRSFVAAVESAVARAGDAVVDMAYFEARALPPTAVCRDTVRAADVYLRWPGSTTARRCATGPSSSYTEIEFEAATEHGLPRLVFLLDEDAEGPRGLLVDREHGDRQEWFRSRLLGTGMTTARFSTPDGVGDRPLPSSGRAARSGRSGVEHPGARGLLHRARGHAGRPARDAPVRRTGGGAGRARDGRVLPAHRPASWVRCWSRAPVEDIPVAGQQRAGGDEVSSVLVASESEPHDAAMNGKPQSCNGGFSVAVLRALSVAVDHPAATLRA